MPRTHPPLPAMKQAATEMQRAFAAERRDALEEAEKIYAGIVGKYPDFADAWHYYGLLLHHRNQSDKGLAALHRAHQLSPDNPLFLFNVSQVLMDTGDIEQGLACIARAHELDPSHGQIFVRYAQLMLNQDGGPEIILPEIEHHLEKNPKSWHLWTLAGQWRERAGDLPGAIEAYDKADSYAPETDPTPQVYLGGLHRSYGHVAEARDSFNIALRRDPNCAKAYMGLSNIAAQEGNFDEAKKLCRKALQISPESYGSWSLLARISDKDEALQLISEILEAQPKTDQSFRGTPIYFALGKLYEDVGEYDKAFENYKTANALMAQFRPYSKGAESRIVQDICDQMQKQFLARAKSVGLTGSGAVFICGMPRSGTTLVETITGSHPAVAMGGELKFLPNWLTREKMSRAPSEKEQVGTWLAAAPDELLKNLTQIWHHTMRELAHEHDLITDKMPQNFKNLGLIATCLPDARIIFVHRNARDNCVSCFTTPFDRGHNYSYSLESLGHYYGLHKTLIAHWQETLPKGKILDVCYEDLIAEPEPQIRRIVDYLGLHWDARCLTPNKTERVVATASVHQVRQPIYSSSIGRWRRFEKHLQPLLDELGEA